MSEQTPEERRAELVERVARAQYAGISEGAPGPSVSWEQQSSSSREKRLRGAGRVLDLLAAEGRLLEPGDLQGSVGIVVRQLRDARVKLAEAEQLLNEARQEVALRRAHQFDPGPVIAPSPIGDGWSVRCLACEAGTLLGLASRQDAERRAELHEHLYPDADGSLPAGRVWPSS